MNKDQSISIAVRNVLFRMGLIRKYCYTIKKDCLDRYVSQITESSEVIQYAFSSNINNSVLFDNPDDAIRLISAYNNSDCAVDVTDDIRHHNCYIYPVIASYQHNKITVTAYCKSSFIF